MARLRRLWVIHTTADVANADTEDLFDLVIDHFPNPEFVRLRHFPDLPNPDERERARTDEYSFDIESLDIDSSDLTADKLRIQIRGNDAWLPSTLWVIGEDVHGTNHLIAGFPSWPSNRWWSKDPSVRQESRRLG